MLYGVVIDLKPEGLLCNLPFFLNEKIQILKNKNKKNYFFATWHIFAATWQPRQHLTDKWMENVTVV